MAPRTLSAGLLVLCLLAGPPAVCRGQGGSPPPPSALGEAPVGVEALPVLPPPEAAAEPAPWYTYAEFAVLFNTAVHLNAEVFSVRENNPVFVSPRVFLGYELDGGGSVRFTYRNLTDVGTLNRRASEPGTSWGRTFTVNWFDLDYVSRDHELLRGWRLNWEAGGRFVYFYTGDSFDTPFSRSDYRSSYFGGGPHLGVTTRCPLGESPWSLFGRADTAITFGGGPRESRYQYWQPDWLQASEPRTWRSSFSGYQYDLNLQLGLVRNVQLGAFEGRVGLGAQLDVLTFGDLGRHGSDAFGLINVGPFVRGEVAF